MSLLQNIYIRLCYSLGIMKKLEKKLLYINQQYNKFSLNYTSASSRHIWYEPS